MDSPSSMLLMLKDSGGYQQACWFLSGACPCGASAVLSRKPRGLGWRCQVSPGKINPRFDLSDSVRQRIKAQKLVIEKSVSDELDYEELSRQPIPMASNITTFQEDFAVDKLRSHVGAIHPLPVLPANQNVAGLVASFFFFGVICDRLWTWSKRNQPTTDSQSGFWSQVPTSFSLFLEKNLQRKESVEWVNMVLGKLWKVYPAGLENWIIGLLQPVIDDLKKPDYVQRVEIKQFSMGDEPLSVRNVERRTSRRANDLQYQIGLRYTGGARMLLSLTLKFGIIPIVVPIGIRNFDIDGELWVKLRLIPSEPWIGAVSWAFVSLPKIKFELSPFRLFNLMAIPVLSMFLTKLLTEDLPQLFVRPKKIVLDFQKGEAHGPVTVDIRSHPIQEGNKDFMGELSVTLVDARRVPYVSFAKTDPYVVLRLGDQVIRSKRNSQTTVIGPPGKPIWNQDFHMLVADPRKEKLHIQLRDSFGFTDFTVGSGEVELGSLQDTVPADRVVALQRGWGLFGKGSSGQILLRLTYKAYVEDEEDDPHRMEFMDVDPSDDETGSDEPAASSEQDERGSASGKGKEPLMDLLAALIVSKEFQDFVTSEAGNSKFPGDAMNLGRSLSRPFGPNSEFSIADTDNTIPGGFTGNHSPWFYPTQPARLPKLACADAGESPVFPAEKVLVWSAMITGIAMLISIKLTGSSFFNS